MQQHQQQQPTNGNAPQSPGASASNMLLRGLEMTRATAEITRQVPQGDLVILKQIPLPGTKTCT